MHTSSRIVVRLAGGILATLLLLAAGAETAPARAAAPEVRAALPLASSNDDSYSFRRFFAGLGRRERVVQFTVGVMCLALFILCKKLNQDSV